MTQALSFSDNKRVISGEKLSSELEEKIKTANRNWGKAKQSVLNVYKQALKDGWTSTEAAKICREKLSLFSPRTIQRILPDEAKNQQMKRVSGYKQIADKCLQTTTQQHEQELQQPFLYSCTCCHKDAIISEVKSLPDNGILMKAVHLDKSIEDHTWPTYDLLSDIGENTAAPKSQQQQKQLRRYKVEMKATVHIEVESEDEVKDRALETLKITGDLLTPIQWRITLIKDSIVEISPLQ